MATNGTISLDEESISNRHIAPGAAIDRSKLAQRANAIVGVPITAWRVHDALGTVIATPASDDLGITTGTFGTNVPYVSTGDLKNAGATTRYARCLVALPPDYEDAETVTLRAYAGMVTTVASSSATLDFEVWRLDKDGTLGAADLCSTSATSINSTTADDKDFTITASTLTKGDILDIRMAIAVNDSATVTAVIGALWQLELLADLR